MCLPRVLNHVKIKTGLAFLSLPFPSLFLQKRDRDSLGEQRREIERGKRRESREKRD